MNSPTYVSFMAMRDWAKAMPSTAEEPAEQEDEAGHERPGDDAGEAPGEGVAPAVDHSQRPVRGDGHQLLAVVARPLGLGVEGPGHWRRREAGGGRDPVGPGRRSGRGPPPRASGHREGRGPR